ncbi:MAG: exopolysaccharide biosynthesis polyprenyl glycosylphosphotransferase [Amaricoccus sp.]|uniref:exopolysaccharide biosynthesis polyprenyl glycosylphosphotransferase n=1 Tax=Amaricoccus sp. TaxID=1872485 RepID=UPI0033151C01
MDQVGVLSIGAHTVARGLRRASLAPGSIAALVAMLDFVGMTLGLWFDGYFSAPVEPPASAIWMSAAAAAGGVALLWSTGAYRLDALRRFRRSVLKLLMVGFALTLLSGDTLAVTPVLAVFLVPARALGAVLVGVALDFGLTERRAVMIGGGFRTSEVMRAMAAAPGNDIRVFGIFDDRSDERSPGVVDGVPRLGTVSDLVAFARTAEIDMLIVTLPLTAEARIRQILKAVAVLPLDVRLANFSNDPAFRRRAGAPAEGGLIELVSRPLRDGELALKRLLDVVGASVAILLLSPIFILTALAIRLDSPGPILFRQPRHGYNHKPVAVWKFRSMYAADCDPTARRIVTKGDPRVTRVGRHIRRWSIDELPQLFNVLAGDLSLVGPRPHALAAVSSRQEAFEEIVEGYAARHKVRPGVTGWAQINGWRGEIDDPDTLRHRVEHDLHYIENWSIWMDLRILVMTPFRLLDGNGAY